MAQKLPIVFREITSEAHLTAYSSFTKRYLDVHYPLDYLKRSKVVALVTLNEDGQIQTMFGGYILALRGPFRVLQQLPRNIVEEHDELQEKLDKCFELTGLWIHPLMKNGTLRAKFWLRLFMDLVAQTIKGKSYALYSYDASKTKLGEMYSICKPCRIFKGEVYIPGMSEQTTEIVEMGSIHAVMRAFYKEPAYVARFLGKRLFRKRIAYRKQDAANELELPAFN
jgi:hypothetical protein